MDLQLHNSPYMLLKMVKLLSNNAKDLEVAEQIFKRISNIYFIKSMYQCMVVKLNFYR